MQDSDTTADHRPDNRLQSARLAAVSQLLGDVHGRLGLKLGFQLWDGSRIPANWPSDGLMIMIADEGVIASIVRRPRADTLIKLHVAGRIEAMNGTMFDLAAARPEGKILRSIKGLPKLLVLKVIRHFWWADRGPPSILDAVRGDELKRTGHQADNKANVAYHYDVSNAFYQLFLDPEMVYTCAYFTEDHDDIARAQRDKLDMICRKLRLRPGDRFLDIGCGWGALVCHAAQHYGVEAHGVTLAEEQFALAQDKVRHLGLDGKVILHLKDFARMEGPFDKIASIGMYEHIGLKNIPAYMQKVRSLLNEDGVFLNHAISRRAPKPSMFGTKLRPEQKAIAKYIFPGGELDDIGHSITAMERAGFEVHDVEAWREHYAQTCRLWCERLTAEKDKAIALVGEEKYRIWVAYLAGVSLAFSRGTLRIFQTVATKTAKRKSPLPQTRADIYRQ